MIKRQIKILGRRIPIIRTFLLLDDLKYKVEALENAILYYENKIQWISDFAQQATLSRMSAPNIGKDSTK